MLIIVLCFILVGNFNDYKKYTVLTVYNYVVFTTQTSMVAEVVDLLHSNLQTPVTSLKR